MEFKIINKSLNWKEVYRLALSTQSKYKVKEPSDIWKKRILLSEHSPIRVINISGFWENLKYWVSVHLVRHKIGIEHFVSSQRPETTGIDRENLPQNSLVTHNISVNVQSIISISRKRLCFKASKDTRLAWKAFLNEIPDNNIVSACVPDCIYRGHCYEMWTCGWFESRKYQKTLLEYRKNIN